MWRVEFSSDRFLPYLPDEHQNVPGVTGYELAHWLSEALAAREVYTSYPQSAEWGWYIEYVDQGLEVIIGCSRQPEAKRPNEWSIFVKPNLSLAEGGVSGVSNEVSAFLAGQIGGLLQQEGFAFQEC
jgi:hypothetical protein